MSTLYGKKLPAQIVQAFISGCVHILGGSGGAPALITKWASEYFPEGSPTEADNPFWPFYTLQHWEATPIGDNAKLEAVDYAYTSTLILGLTTGYGDKVGRSLSRRIGMKMWDGFILNKEHKHLILEHWIKVKRGRHRKRVTNPQYTGKRVENSFKVFLGQPIKEALKSYFHLEHTPPLNELPIEKYRIAVEVFAALLPEKLGIACKTELQETGLTVSFPECPFCLNKQETCRLWCGVLEGMCCWLEDTTPDNYVPFLINFEHSKPHEVVLKKNL